MGLVALVPVVPDPLVVLNEQELARMSKTPPGLRRGVRWAGRAAHHHLPAQEGGSGLPVGF